MLQETTQQNSLANAEVLIRQVQAGAPKASQADIINSLTIAYCPVVMADKTLGGPVQKSEALDGFAERVYTDIVTKGQDTAAATPDGKL